jgi:hypothetical protein
MWRKPTEVTRFLDCGFLSSGCLLGWRCGMGLTGRTLASNPCTYKERAGFDLLWRKSCPQSILPEAMSLCTWDCGPHKTRHSYQQWDRDWGLELSV